MRGIPEDFAARVRAARGYADMNQNELAEKLGMSGGYVKLVEAGKTIRAIEAPGLVAAIAAATGLPEEFLWGGPEHQEHREDAWVTQLFEKLDQVRVEQGTRVLEVLKRVDALEGTILQSQRQRPA